MLSKQLAVGLAVLAGLLLTSTAKADNDMIRLATHDSSANTLTLQGHDDDEADTLLVARYGGGRGGFYGGYRGGYGGYRGGYASYRGGYYGGYRGGYYGGYRGGYYGGYRGGYYGGYRYGGYYPRYYGGYYPRYYSSYYYPSYYPSYSYYYPSYGYSYSAYYPISGNCDNESRVLVVPPSSSNSLPQPNETLPGPTPRIMPRADDGTFPYDGGPKAPVPMPKIVPQQEMEARSLDVRPTVVPFDSIYPDETLVSMKAKAEKTEPKTGKWNFPAYGEVPTRSKK